MTNQLRDQTSESLRATCSSKPGQHALLTSYRHARMGTRERNCRWLNYPGGLLQSGGGRASGRQYYVVLWGYVRKNPLLVPRKRHRTGEQTATSILKQRTKIPCAAASCPPAKPARKKTVVGALLLIRVTGSVSPAPETTTGRDACIHALVKTQKCMTCGNQADDLHHIIGHGLGGMGTKADDCLLFRCAVNVITNCTPGVKDFEENTQPAVAAIRFLMHAKFGCPEVESMND